MERTGGAEILRISTARFAGNARLAGNLLAIGGILFFIAGVLHPHSTGGALLASMAGMLSDPLWALAHWVSYVSVVLIILALWLLMDSTWADGSLAARAGIRLTIIGGLFMMVEFAVELATKGAVGILAAGNTVPIFHLFATMHAAGWPTIAAGFITMILGIREGVPLAIRIIGIVGALAMGLAGILVAGFYLTSFGALFIGGDLLAIWIVWAGVQIARGRMSDSISLVSPR
ncbi:MAG: hypothetical protein ACRD3F_07165 [Acidobacteriaceae bacterium]